MKQVEIYTDGGCRGNGSESNIGAYGIVLMYNGHKKEVAQAFYDTTNNRMELLGVIEGLRLLKEPCVVTLYSDSAYVVDAINKQWLENWKSRGWIKPDKQPVKNQDLWEMLLSQLSMHKVSFVKVPGHADNEGNNRCDLLVNQAMDVLEKKQLD